MINENDLRDELDRLVNDLSEYSSNPASWQTWIQYLLRGLDSKAMDVNPAHQELYEDMLALLQDLIRNRLKTGGW